jgi:hypothetical protein
MIEIAMTRIGRENILILSRSAPVDFKVNSENDVIINRKKPMMNPF